MLTSVCKVNEALETSEAYKIVILRSTRLNLNALNRKLSLDIKLKNKSVDPFNASKVFGYTSLKLDSLNRKLYADLKMVSILKIRLETSL